MEQFKIDAVEKIAHLEESLKSAHHRIDDLQEMSKDIKDLATATAQIAAETKALREDYLKADKRIETLEHKPAKRYETFVTALLTGLGTGIVGYIIGFMFS